MATAREPVRFNEQDDNRTTITKLNRLVDELYTKLSAAELRVSQVLKFTKDPAADYVLTSDADGKASWAENPSTEPGGSDTHVQFNDGGALGGDSGMSYDKATNTLTLAGDLTGVNTVGCTDVDATGEVQVGGAAEFKDDLSVTGTDHALVVGADSFFYLKNQTVPATAASTGVRGTLIADGSHIYYCTATNTWKRVAISW